MTEMSLARTLRRLSNPTRATGLISGAIDSASFGACARNSRGMARLSDRTLRDIGMIRTDVAQTPQALPGDVTIVR